MLKNNFINLINKYSKNEVYNLMCWIEIEKNYSLKSRHYHNLTHLSNMLKELEDVKNEVNKLDTLLFSLFYHDIVYKATRSDNELKSAIFFEKRISKTSFPFILESKTQIKLTKEHKVSNDLDTNIFMDLDLSILGKSKSEYENYYKNVRKEYKIYPDFMYNKGRVKALKSILESDKIFKTDFFINKYEEKARENINLEIDFLS